MENVREAFFVFFGKTVGGTFGGGGFKIVEIAGFFLVFDEFGAHVDEYFFGKVASEFGGNVVVVIGEVSDGFVDSVEADGGEVVVEVSEVSFGVGVEAAIHPFLNFVALCFEGVFGHVHELSQTSK